MSTQEDKLKKLIAKEQHLRKLVNKEPAIEPSPASEERKATISPQSMDESRKRLARLLRGRSPSRAKLSAPTPSPTKSSSTGLNKSEKEEMKKGRAYSFTNLFSAKDSGEEASFEVTPPILAAQMGKKRSVLEASKAAKVETRMRERAMASSPQLVRGGHHAALASSSTSNAKTGRPSINKDVLKPNDSSENFETDDDEAQQYGEEEEVEGVYPSAVHFHTPDAKRNKDRSGTQESKFNASIQTDLSGDHELAEMESVLNSMHIDSNECYEFMVKRHYDANYDLSTLIRTGFEPAELSSLINEGKSGSSMKLSEAINYVVKSAGEILQTVDITNLHLWYSPSINSISSVTASTISDRLINKHSKRELPIDILSQHKPHMDVLLSSTSSQNMYNIYPDDEVYEDIYYVLKSCSNSNFDRPLEYLSVVLIRHPLFPQKCLGVLIATIGSNIYHIYNPKNFHQMDDDEEESKQNYKQMILSNAMVNIYQCNTYFESMQRLLCKQQIEKLGGHIDSYLRQCIWLKKIDDLLVEEKRITLEIKLKSVLRNLSLSLTNLLNSPQNDDCGDNSLTSHGASFSDISKIVCEHGLEVFSKVWVFIVSKENLHDSVFYQCQAFCQSRHSQSLHTQSYSIKDMTAEMVDMLQGNYQTAQSFSYSSSSNILSFLYKQLQSTHFVASTEESKDTDNVKLLRVACKLVSDSQQEMGQVSCIVFVELPKECDGAVQKLYEQNLSEIMKTVEQTYYMLVKSMKDEIQRQMVSEKWSDIESKLAVPFSLHSSGKGISDPHSHILTHIASIIAQIQSEDVSQRLNAKRTKLLLSTELCRLFGVNVEAEQNSFMYYRNGTFSHLSTQTSSSEKQQGNSLLWLCDLLNRKVVHYCKNKSDGSKGNDLSPLLALRRSLHAFISSLSPSFTSAILIPIAIEGSFHDPMASSSKPLLALLVVLDYRTHLGNKLYSSQDIHSTRSDLSLWYAECVASSPLLTLIKAAFQRSLDHTLAAKEIVAAQSNLYVQREQSESQLKSSQLKTAYERWRQITTLKRLDIALEEKGRQLSMMEQLVLYRMQPSKSLQSNAGDSETFVHIYHTMARVGFEKGKEDFTSTLLRLAQAYFPNDQIILRAVENESLNKSNVIDVREISGDVFFLDGAKQYHYSITVIRSRQQKYSLGEKQVLDDLCKRASVVYTCMTLGTETTELIEEQERETIRQHEKEACLRNHHLQLLSLASCLSNVKKLQKGSTSGWTNLVLEHIRALVQCDSAELFDGNTISIAKSFGSTPSSLELREEEARRVLNSMQFSKDRRGVQIHAMDAAMSGVSSSLTLDLHYSSPQASHDSKELTNKLLLCQILLTLTSNCLQCSEMCDKIEHNLDQVASERDQCRESMITLQQHLKSCAREMKESSAETKYIYQLLQMTLQWSYVDSLDELTKVIWNDWNAVFGSHSILLALKSSTYSDLLPEGRVIGHSSLSSYHIFWPQSIVGDGSSPMTFSPSMPSELSYDQILSFPNLFNPETSSQAKQCVIKLLRPGSDEIFGVLLLFNDNTVLPSSSLEQIADLEYSFRKKYSNSMQLLLSAGLHGFLDRLQQQSLTESMVQSNERVQQLKHTVSKLEEEKKTLLNRAEPIVSQNNKFALQIEDLERIVQQVTKENESVVTAYDMYKAKQLEVQAHLEEENIKASQQLQMYEKLGKIMRKLVHSYVADPRCSINMIEDAGGNSKAILWLRDCVDAFVSEECTMFLAINNNIPSALQSVSALHLYILEAQKDGKSIEFTSKYRMDSHPFENEATWDVSSNQAAMKKKLRMQDKDNVALLVVPVLFVDPLPTGNHQVTAFIFVKDVANSASKSEGETLFSTENKSIIETLCGLTSKLLSLSYIWKGEDQQEGGVEHKQLLQSRVRQQDRALSRFREAYHAGKVLLSCTYKSIDEVSATCKEHVVSLLKGEVNNNISIDATVLIYTADTATRYHEKEPVRKGNQLILPILSTFKRRIIGHMLVSKNFVTEPSQKGLDALSVQDLMISLIEEELLQVIAIFVSYLMSKMTHISEAHKSIQEASETISIMQKAYNTVQEEVLLNVETRLLYESGLKSANDLLFLSATKRTHLSQLIESVRKHMVQLSRSTECYIYLPSSVENVVAEVLLEECSQLEDLQSITLEQNNGVQDLTTGFYYYPPQEHGVRKARFEESDLEAKCLEQSKLLNISQSNASCFTFRKYVYSLQLEADINKDHTHTDDNDMSAYSILTLPFRVFDSSGIAVLVRKGTDVYDISSVEVIKHLLSTLSYCIVYRNNQHNTMQSNVKIQTMQEELLHLRKIEKSYQTLKYEGEDHSNAVDLLLDVPTNIFSKQTNSFALKYLHPKPDSTEQGEMYWKEYILSTLSALHYQSSVEECTGDLFQALQGTEVEFKLERKGELTLCLRVGVLDQDTNPNSILILPYKHNKYISNHEDDTIILVGLLQVMISSCENSFQYTIPLGDSMPGKDYLMMKFKLLFYQLLIFHGFCSSSKMYQNIVAKQYKQMQVMEEKAKESDVVYQSSMDELRSACQAEMKAQQEQGKLQLLQRKYTQKLVLYLHHEAMIVANQVLHMKDESNIEILPKSSFMSNWSRISERVGYRFALGKLSISLPDANLNAIEWIRNEHGLTLTESIMRQVHGSMQYENRDLIILNTMHSSPSEDSSKNRNSVLLDYIQSEHSKLIKLVDIDHSLPGSKDSFSVIMLVAAKLVQSSSVSDDSRQTDYFLLYFTSASDSKEGNIGLNSIIHQSLLNALYVFLLAMERQANNVNIRRSCSNLDKRAKALRLVLLQSSLEKYRDLQSVCFANWKAQTHYLPSIQELTMRAVQYKSMQNELQYCKYVLTDYKHVGQQVNDRMNQNESIFKDIVILYEAMDGVVHSLFKRVYDSQQIQYDVGLIVWTDEDDPVVNNNAANQHSANSRLMEVTHTTGTSEKEKNVEKKSILYLGNRVHATLMDIFNERKGYLQPLYIINRWEVDQGKVVYLLPIRRDSRILAVLRITIHQGQQYDSKQVDDRNYIYKEDNFGYEHDVASSLLSNKRLETCLVFFSMLLCPYIMYNNIYYHQLQQVQNTNKSIANYKQQLDVIENEIYHDKSHNDIQNRLLYAIAECMREDVVSKLHDGSNNKSMNYQTISEVMSNLAAKLGEVLASNVSIVLDAHALDNNLTASSVLSRHPISDHTISLPLYNYRKDVSIGYVTIALEHKNTMKVYVAIINYVVLILSRNAENSRRISTLERDKNVEESQRSIIQSNCDALQQNLSESILTQRFLEHHITMLQDGLNYSSEAYSMSCFDKLLDNSKSVNMEQSTNVLEYLQRIINSYAHFFRTSPELSTTFLNIGINIAMIVQQSDDDMHGIEHNSLKWLHAVDTTANADQDRSLAHINILLWEYLPDSARSLCVSFVHNTIDKNMKSAVDIPSHSIRVLSIPTVDIYSQKPLGAVQVLLQTGGGEIEQQNLFFDDLAALVSRILSVQRISSAMSDYLVQQDINSISKDSQFQRLENEVTLLRKQSAVYQKIVSFIEDFLTTSGNSNYDIVSYIEKDTDDVMKALRSQGIDISIHKGASSTVNRHNPEFDVVISRSTIEVSGDPYQASIELVFYLPNNIVNNKQTYSLFVYHIVAVINKFIQSMLSLQTKMSRVDGEKKNMRGEIAKLRDKTLEEQNKLIDKAASLYKKYQSLKDSSKATQSLVSRAMQDYQNKSEAICKSIMTVAQHSSSSNPFQDYLSLVHTTLQQYHNHSSNITSSSNNSLQYSWSYLHLLYPFSSSDNSDAIKIRLVQHDRPVSNDEQLIIRDRKLRQTSNSVTPMNQQSGIEECLLSSKTAASSSVVKRSYHLLNGTQQSLFSASDLIGLDSSIITRVSRVTLLLINVYSITSTADESSNNHSSDATNEEKNSQPSGSQISFTGILRLAVFERENSDFAQEGRTSQAVAEQKPDSPAAHTKNSPLAVEIGEALQKSSSYYITSFHIFLLQQCCLAIVKTHLQYKLLSNQNALSRSYEAECNAAKEQLSRIKKLHKHMTRECSAFMDYPSHMALESSRLASMNEEYKHTLSVLPYQHIASLPPLQAAQEIVMKALSIIRKVLRSSVQCIVFSSSTIATNSTSSGIGSVGSNAYNVMYTGDYSVYGGIPIGTFGHISWSASKPLRTPRNGTPGDALLYQSIIEYILFSGKTFVTPNLLHHSYYNPAVDGSFHQTEGKYCYIGIPLRGSNGELIGVLYAVRNDGEFTWEEQIAAEYVGSATALNLYWCSGLASRHYTLHKAFQKIQKLESVLLKNNNAEQK